ncbi:MAG: aldehyde oxidase and xanthine dehydrogenase molybdopterin binding protein, partial [Chloroflexi bacterium]|nr:aldehyde oxidase and xanthine dehydrogenase molybdopterin binding protein [Chloroflexota bacterium]
MVTTFSTVHKSVPRVDGERKVTGAAKYTADLQLPGLLHARLVLSTYPHARITSIVRDAAEQVPGVVGVYTAGDVEMNGRDNGSRNRRPLAKDIVRFDGHWVAVVVAETEAAAQDAADLVEVEYEELPVVADMDLAMQHDSPRVILEDTSSGDDEAFAHASVGGGAEAVENLPPNVTNAKRYRRGNIEAGFAEADVVIERTYKTSWVHQLHLEPQSSTAAPDGAGNLTVWTSTQGAFSVRNSVATSTGLPQHRVNVISMEVGGAFGAKYALIDPLVGALAWQLQRPVTLIYSRGDEMRSANPAPAFEVQVSTGAKKDGTLTALKARIVADNGAYSAESAGLAGVLLGGSYKWPNLEITAYDVMSHKTGSSAYRAPGAPQAAFAIEGQMAEMARALDLDPLEFRIKNTVETGDPLPDGEPLPLIGGRQVLEKLAEHPLWTNRSNKPGEGVGISYAWWPGAMQPANSSCRLDDDGSITVLVGSTDISGSNTSMAQIAAEAFGVPMSMVNIRTVDTNAAPFAGPSGGSKTIYTTGAAVASAARDARRQALEIAAQELEVAPEDLEVVDGTVSVKGVPGRTLSMRDIASKSIGWGGSYEPVLGRGGSSISTAAPGFTIHLARVSVDEETGKVDVLDYLAIQDVGCAINPAEVEGQIHGGVTQGLGIALYEAIPYGEDGRLVGSSLMDYALPTTGNVPVIQTLLVEVPSADGPFGAKGVGEPPIIPGAGAIANAILDATG